MKLKENSTEQKLRGAYYTPMPLAEKMVEFFKDNHQISNILEPSCGDGVFIDAIHTKIGLREDQYITAIEIEKEAAEKVKQRFVNEKNINVVEDDFFSFYTKDEKKKYDLILGNPPYIRYQYLAENQRIEMSDILKSQGMKANKLINTWVAFLVACVNMLTENGKIAFVIPAEILQVAYAEDLRLYLAEHLSQITLITFEELIFPDIEQEVIVLIGEKGKEEKGIRIIELQNLDDLSSLNLGDNGYQKLQHVHEKWTKYFTTQNETELISQIRKDDRFRKLSECAMINVGITTGNNKYFSVNQKIVDEYKLKDVVRPLIGKSSHANSIFFDQDEWQKNIDRGKAAYLIDFPDEPFEEYPITFKKYIKMGEKMGENSGYKCQIRERWYKIPSIWVPDAFFLRRNNLYPKFVLNCCNAVSTDTMHRIKFYDGINAEKIILSYYCSIAFAFTEICGRSYGGGVLEILPSEAGEICLPIIDIVPDEVVHKMLMHIDQIIRKNEDIEKALNIVDQNIIEDYLQIPMNISLQARNIWKKMQRRRLRRS